MSVATGNPITQAQLDDLATLANTKLAPGTPYEFVEDATDFLTELQRIRTDLFTAIDAAPLAAEFRVSDLQVIGINPNYCTGELGRLYFASSTDPVPATNYLPYFRDVRFVYAFVDQPDQIALDDPDIGLEDPDIAVDPAAPTVKTKLRYTHAPTIQVPWTITEQTALTYPPGTPPPYTRNLYDFPYDPLEYEQAFDCPVASHAVIVIEIPLAWQGDGTAPTPTLADFDITIDFGTFTQEIVEIRDEFIFGYGTFKRATLRFTGTAELPSGAQSINYSVTPNTRWSCGGRNLEDPWTDTGWTWPATDTTARGDRVDVTISASVVLTVAETDSADTVATTIIHPGSEGRSIPVADLTNAASFTITTHFAGEPAAPANVVRGIHYLELNTDVLPGVWIGRTLPTPAVNVYLDQDIPPYVRRRGNLGFPLFVDDGNTTYGLGIGGAIAKDARHIFDDQSPPAVLNPRTAQRQPAPCFTYRNRREIAWRNGYADWSSIPDSNLIEGSIPTTTESALTPLASGATVARSLVWPFWVYTPYDPYGVGPSGTDLFSFVTTGGTFTIYLSAAVGIDPDNPATYAHSVAATDVATITYATIVAELGSDIETVYYLVKNTGADFSYIVSESVFTPPDLVDTRMVEPSIQPAPTAWPVMRDTDDYPWFGGQSELDSIDPYRFKWPFAEAAALAIDAEANHIFSIADFDGGAIWSGQLDWSLTTSPSLPIYVKFGGPYPTHSNPASYDFTVTGTLTRADVVSHYGPDHAGQIYLTVWNNSGAAVTLQLTARKTNFTKRFRRWPVLCPMTGYESGILPLHGLVESWSNNLRMDTGEGTAYCKRIPLRGYAIYSVLVRRLPVLADLPLPEGEEIYLPPTTGLAEITVSLGIFRGLTHTSFEAVDKGTFTELATVTIPAGELEARVNVFWPVLWGTLIVYQASEALYVEALANWQPIFHSRQYANAPYINTNGISSLRPDAVRFDGTLRFQNAFEPTLAGWFGFGNSGDTYVQFPMAAAVYNDLISALTNL